MRESRLRPSRIARTPGHPTLSSDNRGRGGQTGTPNFSSCRASHAEKPPSLRRRANGTRFGHVTALRIATAGKPAQTREYCTSSKNLVLRSDHLPLLLCHAFSQNAFCYQHVKYRERDAAIRFSYEI